MKLKQLYEFFIQQGIKRDPRGAQAVKKLLKERKERYEKLPPEEKEGYDVEMLSNPYADSRILNGTGEEEVKSVLLGIDMETPEILLANTLKAGGKNIDLVLTHHPEGKAYATFYNVMSMQADIFNKFGVPINIAEAMTEARLKEVGRKVMPQNHSRAVDAAKLLGLPYMSAHTVADNHVTTFLQELFDNEKPDRLNDVMKILKAIPEYKTATEETTGPTILTGGKDSRAGKIFVDMTGGTEPAKELLEKLADAGIGTMICMHMSDEHYKLAEKHNIRVVIAGHISSDNLGLNLLLDEAEKEFGPIQILECSGFRRFRRSKK
ncbi:MAG: NGG1p interacting factor NIF3 [Elusimicrobiota bacterium]